jgi:23S rRNA (pseudouridine1915-N3)-methyltransferase
MHVRLIAVGKLREAYLNAAAADFRTRLRPYHRLEEIEVRAAGGADPARAIAAEGAAIRALLAPNDHVWLLERSGTEFDSTAFAARIERLAVDGISAITFVIAGTFGAAPELLERANVRWSLSRLTFLHAWARVLVLEQLYRAAKIAANEPYHH